MEKNVSYKELRVVQHFDFAQCTKAKCGGYFGVACGDVFCANNNGKQCCNKKNNKKIEN